MRTLISIILIGICLYLLSCQDQVQVEDSLKGTYSLNTEDGKTYSIQLIRARDGVVYGTIDLQSDTAHFDAPLTLDKDSPDSLRLGLWYGSRYIALAKGKEMKGKAKIEDGIVNVKMEKIWPEVSEDLEASANMTPLPLSAEAPAFCTFKSDGSIYLIGWSDHKIYLAKETEEGWEETPVPYDEEKYTFSSIGLSPDEKMLVAHGSRIFPPAADQEKGSIYLLHLSDETRIDSVQKLPNSINTPSYDNFPDFTASGDIIFSSWGAAAGETKAGRGDLYRSTYRDSEWTTLPLSSVLNTYMSDAGPSMNQGETAVFFHRNARKPKPMADKIFASKKQGREWEAAFRLPPPINITHSGQYGPRLDPKGEYFYWTSHHRGKGHLYRIRVSEVPELASLLN